MIFKRIFFSLAGLGGITGMVAGVVSCGKTANAVLPVEFVIPSESISFRSDRSDARSFPGLTSWNQGSPVVGITAAQAVLQAKIAPGIVGALKRILAGYVGNYDEINDDWKALFADINAQRQGSGSTMVEMSRMYFRDSGKLVFTDGKTSVAPKETGKAEFVINAIHFDGYATNGNSPAESFQGLLGRAMGHHWELDLSADPIVLTVEFINNNVAASDSQDDIDKASIKLVDGVNFDVLQSYAISTRSANLTQAQYRAILDETPTATNYYKNRVSAVSFKQIFGANTKPVKVTTEPGA